MKKGTFCLSIDHELLWGRRNLDYRPFIPRVKKERVIIKRLLYLFDKYKIHVTWAVVGKLFEEGDPLWYGLDTINEIKKHKNQEIGSHSYSHELFSKISKSEAEKEIEKCKGPKSFVFPRNKIGHFDVLKKFGFVCYRGGDKRNWELFFPGRPPVYEPFKNHGLLNIPGSLYFVSARGARKYIPYGLRLLKSILGIESAIAEKKVFHLWFHPIDFANNSEALFKEFGEILKFATQKRKEGLLEIKTMKQIAENYYEKLLG